MTDRLKFTSVHEQGKDRHRVKIDQYAEHESFTLKCPAVRAVTAGAPSARPRLDRHSDVSSLWLRCIDSHAPTGTPF